MKRLSLILILLFGLIFTSFAQMKTPSAGDDAKYLKFYPNPATTTIAFEFVSDYDKSYSIHIYNFMGKEVYELKTVSQIVNVPLDEFYRGMYIYQLRDGNGAIIESGKFQVVK
ncbi:MAG TPA: T9SS type A sorting domain-containing protein [Ferruginibacter sp.]|nr:T9SS type A sorting domain-containing protein [Ferruginibacter sp.]